MIYYVCIAVDIATIICTNQPQLNACMPLKLNKWTCHVITCIFYGHTHTQVTQSLIATTYLHMYLCYLVENICLQVSRKSKTSITELLVEQLRLLTTLNISGCTINDRGADMIAAVLLESISLRQLDLSNTMLDAIKTTTINNALKNISSLKVFNLNSNDIDDRAANSIAAVIHSNSLIEIINISHNNLSSTGVLNIAYELSIAKNIKIFNVSNNSIASDSITDLATTLSKCHVLQELNLSHNSLRLTDVLIVAQCLRYHPTLKTLNLSSNVMSFPSACEFIVDVILSVNQSLINLNVCGRNIRPRNVENMSLPSSEKDLIIFSLQHLYSLQHSSLSIRTNFIKVVETCPISSRDIISYYADYLGGVFYNKYHNFAIVIPPGAVSQGDCVEIQATANYFGPYIIPDKFYPISSCFWVSANYTFSAPVYFIMNHYASIRSLEDVKNLHVLQTSVHDSKIMSTTLDGVYFDCKIGYCVLATNHFCSYCQAKSDRSIPEYLLACYSTFDEPSTGSYIAEVCFCPSNTDCKKVNIKE